MSSSALLYSIGLMAAGAVDELGKFMKSSSFKEHRMG
jgi:hypothetical protein